MRLISILFLCIVLFASCANRDLAYFSDMADGEEYVDALPPIIESKIRLDDILSKTITSFGEEVNALFNIGNVLAEGTSINYQAVNQSSFHFTFMRQ